MSAGTAPAAPLAPERDPGLVARYRLVARGGRDDIVVSAVAWLVLVVLVLVLWGLQHDTLSFKQVGAYADLSVVFAVMAVGQIPVLLTGGIDVSVGGTLSVTNVLTALLVTSDSSIAWGTVVVLAAGAGMGLVNGLLIVYGRIQPLLVTLAMWFAWAGLALILLPVPGGTIPRPLAWIVTGNVAGVPNAYWVLVLLALLGCWFLRTRLGLRIRAIGSDPLAAEQSGVPVKATLVATYTVSGLMIGIGGLLLAGQNSAGDPTTGANYLLPVITATVVGGTSLLGGRGGAIGGIVGAMILTYVAAVAFAANLSAQWSTVIDGVILILAVALQHFLRRRLGSKEVRP